MQPERCEMKRTVITLLIFLKDFFFFSWQLGTNAKFLSFKREYIQYVWKFSNIYFTLSLYICKYVNSTVIQ
jgi:hypothetical protein